MAVAISAQIAAYKAAKLDRDGESPEKCEIVQALEPQLSQPAALSFYLDLIADPDEYDMARLEPLTTDPQIGVRVERILKERI